MGSLYSIDTFLPADGTDYHKYQILAYTYDVVGRMENIWDPYANELVLYSVPGLSAADAPNRVGYDGSGRVAWVQTAKRTATLEAVRHSYGYATSTATVTVGTPSGGGVLTSSVAFDSERRVTSTTDPAGHVTSQVFAPPSATHAKDLVLTITDAGGRRMQRFYDNVGRVTESYGPCPAAAYGADRRPVGGVKCPGTLSVYDGETPVSGTLMAGTQGLLGTYWIDASPSQHMVGAPVAVNTIPNLGMNWAASSPTGGVGGVGGQNWSARFTGYVRFDTAGVWKVRIGQGDGARLWIDDRLLVNSWGEIYGNSEYGTFTVAAGETGWHRIRVDMFERVGPSLLEVHVTPPGGTEFNLSSQYLSPGFDRVTKQTVLDDTGVASNVTTTDYLYDNKPWLGLVKSTTIVMGGPTLDLKTQYTYDSGHWYRLASKVMPGGNTWQYTYWGAGELGSCGSANGVSQMGRLRRVQLERHGFSGQGA